MRLDPERRAEPAAAGVSTPVDEPGVPDQVLAGHADHGELEAAGALRGSALPRRGSMRRYPKVARGHDAHLLLVDQQQGWLGGPAGDHQCVEAGALAGEGEVRRREGVGESPGERRLGDHRELGRRGDRRSAERAERKDHGRLGAERIALPAGLLEEQERTEADAADHGTERGVVERRGLGLTRVTSTRR